MPSIGNIVISSDRQATASEFWFTVNNPNSVQLGSYVVVEGQNRRIVGLVEELVCLSEVDSSSQYLSEQMGPQPRILPTVIRLAKAKILISDPPTSSPPLERWPVRLLDRVDTNLLHRDIPPNKRLLMGFIKNPNGYLPLYAHAEYVIGTQAAHTNITGKTGLATKTSYALFEIMSIMKYAKDVGLDVAVVMFNVKGKDLMELHKLPDKNKVEDELRNFARRIGLDENEIVSLYREALNEGLDQHAFLSDIKYFTFPNDQFDPSRSGYSNVIHYSYGMCDLNVDDVIAALYRPEEALSQIERQTNLIYTYFEEANNLIQNNQITFNNMIDDFRIFSRFWPDRLRVQPIVRLDDWHPLAAGAVYRRLTAFRSRARNVVKFDRPNGTPINPQAIEPNKINVIQIYGLSEAEQRLVVNAVLRSITEELESGGWVDRVVIFIDELNKYAPEKTSPIKEQIVDIAARGRYVGLSLIGAQQFASQIDSQVYGNCSVKVVGVTDDAELSKEIYRFLGVFKDAVRMLQKGQLIVYHDLSRSPVIVEFPVPIALSFLG